MNVKSTILATLKSLLLSVILLLCTTAVHAQSISDADFKILTVLEDSMLTSIDSMYSVQLADDREIYARRFAKQLVQALKTPNSYSYDFKKIGEKINIIGPDDKSFRIFNWVIAPTEVTRRYYGAIQLPGASLKLHGLVDCSSEFVKGMEDSVFTGGRWYGALYYRVMPEMVNGQKVYILFGINDGAIVSTKKVLDPMVITANGPVFGMPLFGISSETQKGQPINRYIMEYKKGAMATLNWKAEFDAIVFDKLISETNDPNRKYTFVPSGQYDGLRWNGSSFTYIPDLIPIIILKDGELPQGGRE